MRDPVGVHAIAHFAGVGEDRNIARARRFARCRSATRAGPAAQREPRPRARPTSRVAAQPGSAAVMASTAALASATIPTRTGKFMPIWVGSRSIWIRSAGTVIRRQSVITSVNRQPTASMASAWGRRIVRACGTRMSERKRVAFVEQALAVQRGHDRRTQAAGESFDGRGRARPEGTSAGQDDRPRCAGEKLGGSARSRRREGGGGRRREEIEPGAMWRTPVPASDLAAGRGQPVEAGRSSWPGTRWRRRSGSRSTCRTVPHHFVAGSKDRSQVDLVVVAAFAIERRRVDLAGDQKDRHRIGPAFGDARERIGRARPGRRANDAGAARHARIAVGRERPCLLVANQDGVDRAWPRATAS